MAAVFAFGKRKPVSNYLISKGFDFDGVKVGSRSAQDQSAKNAGHFPAISRALVEGMWLKMLRLPCHAASGKKVRSTLGKPRGKTFCSSTAATNRYASSAQSQRALRSMVMAPPMRLSQRLGRSRGQRVLDERFAGPICRRNEACHGLA